MENPIDGAHQRSVARQVKAGVLVALGTVPVRRPQRVLAVRLRLLYQLRLRLPELLASRHVCKHVEPDPRSSPCRKLLARVYRRARRRQVDVVRRRLQIGPHQPLHLHTLARRQRQHHLRARVREQGQRPELAFCSHGHRVAAAVAADQCRCQQPRVAAVERCGHAVAECDRRCVRRLPAVLKT